MNEEFWFEVIENMKAITWLADGGLLRMPDIALSKIDLDSILEQACIIEQLLGQESLPCFLLTDGTDMFSFVQDELEDIKPHFDFKNSVPISAFWEKNE